MEQSLPQIPSNYISTITPAPNHQMSYKYECNINNQIYLKYYYDTYNCNNPSLSNITNYDCNYSNNILCNDNTINECIQNNECNYIETRIINECLQMNDAHYLIWQCYDKYYIGLIYNNINCNHLVETYKFEYGECVDGLIQYRSCDSVNIGGTNLSRGINVCQPVQYYNNNFFYKFECMEKSTENGVSLVVKKWYNMNGCIGTPFHIGYFDNNDIIAYKCSNDIITCNQRKTADASLFLYIFLFAAMLTIISIVCLTPLVCSTSNSGNIDATPFLFMVFTGNSAKYMIIPTIITDIILYIELYIMFYSKNYDESFLQIEYLSVLEMI